MTQSTREARAAAALRQFQGKPTARSLVRAVRRAIAADIMDRREPVQDEPVTDPGLRYSQAERVADWLADSPSREPTEGHTARQVSRATDPGRFDPITHHTIN